jgi:RNA recognition motif-containing protein
MVTDRDTGKAKGFAFCEFYDVPTAVSAQRNLNGFEFNGRKLRVDYADDQHKGDRKGRASLSSVTHVRKRVVFQKWRLGPESTM